MNVDVLLKLSRETRYYFIRNMFSNLHNRMKGQNIS